MGSLWQAAVTTVPHPTDEKYRSLNCGLAPMDKKHEMWPVS